MSLAYIHRLYGVRAKRGQRVEVDGRPGRITVGTNYVHILLDGEKHSRRYHPLDPGINYKPPAPPK